MKNAHPFRFNVSIDILLAIFQRLLVVYCLFQISSGSFNLQTITGLRDGSGYLNLAYGFVHGSFFSVPLEDTQYFIGYPFFLSIFLHVLPAWAAVYLFQFACIAGSLAIAVRLFENPWIARWMIFCIPSYVLFTSVNMSESLLMFLVFAAAYAYQQKKFFITALMLGCALITRPQSMFLLYLLLLVSALKNRHFIGFLSMIFWPAIFLAGMHLFNAEVFGDAFHNYRLYGAHESHSLLAMPFSGYWTYSQDVTIRLTNRIYIWLFTFFIAAGLILFWGRSKRQELSPNEKLFLHWGTLQFLFFLSLNSRWGFMELPRYFIPVLPSALMGYHPKTPKTWLWVIILGGLSIAFAVYAEGSGNRYAY